MHSPSSWICDLANGRAENLFFSKQMSSCISDDAFPPDVHAAAASWRERSTKQILVDSDEEDLSNTTNRAHRSTPYPSSSSAAIAGTNHHRRTLSGAGGGGGGNNAYSSARAPRSLLDEGDRESPRAEGGRDGNTSLHLHLSSTPTQGGTTPSPAVLGRFTPSQSSHPPSHIKVPSDVEIGNSTTVSSVSQHSTAMSRVSRAGTGTGTKGNAGSETGQEARIVAPNVSKLSPNSAVEVRLQSPSECVAVLCSVDVLKMRYSACMCREMRKWLGYGQVRLLSRRVECTGERATREWSADTRTDDLARRSESGGSPAIRSSGLSRVLA